MSGTQEEALAILGRPRNWTVSNDGGQLDLPPGVYPTKRAHVEELLQDIAKVEAMGLDDDEVKNELRDAKSKARVLCARSFSGSKPIVVMGTVIALGLIFNYPPMPVRNGWQAGLFELVCVGLYLFGSRAFGYRELAKLLRPKKNQSLVETLLDYTIVPALQSVFLIVFAPLNFVLNYVLHQSPRGQEVLAEATPGASVLVDWRSMAYSKK